jgi:hypothetical protein
MSAASSAKRLKRLGIGAHLWSDAHVGRGHRVMFRIPLSVKTPRAARRQFLALCEALPELVASVRRVRP